MDEKLISALLLCFKKAPEAAVNYLKSQGFKITWDWQEQLKAIQEHSFTVSKVSNADILQMLKEELQKALESGKTYNDFKKDLEPLLKDKGYAKKEDGTAWRLDTIYRMNLQSSYMAGRYYEMKAVEEDFPYWEMVVVSDSRTSPICRKLVGVILPANSPFWKTHYPPLHYGCRTRVVSRSLAMLERDGKIIGRIADYRGIKPAEGFDYSPGQWKPDFTKFDPKIKKQLQKVVA